jgi:hypothetical protein
MSDNDRLAIALTYLGEVGQRYREGDLRLNAWLALGLGQAAALILLDIAETLREIKDIFRKGQNG